ncbi:MAG: hypothetical protein AB7F59_02625 [Bdellovibrionales bacterium]
MKKSIWITIVLSALIGSGCNKASESPGANPSTAYEVEQGNGMVRYQNVAMNISFDYPRSWRLLEEAPNKVSLDNSTTIPNQDESSKIEFGLYPDLDGTRVTSQEDLKKYLESRWPSMRWKKTTMVRKEGFWHEEASGNFRKGTYYLIDQNYNILYIHYTAFKKSDGIKVIEGIVKDLSIDFEGPQVLSVHFDRTEVKPGETVTLTIVADDELSSVDPLSISWASTRCGHSGPSVGSAIGYKRNDTFNKYGWFQCPYELRDEVRVISSNKFEYKLKIPTYAPAGTLRLQTLRLADIKGNRTQLFAYRDEDDVYYGYDLKIVEVKVLNEAGFTPDLDKPKIVDVFFEKSKLLAEDPIQNLFIKISDRSVIRPDVEIKLDLRNECYSSNQVLKKIKDDLYSLEYNFNNLFKREGGCFHQGRLIRVHLDSSFENSIRDEVGNEFERTDKTAIFEVIK